MSITILDSTSIDGTISITSIANATTNTNRFLVSDSGVVKYRTGAQVRSDIGAGTSSTVGTVTSVGISHAGDAFTVGSAITTAGTLDITMAGTSAQYIDGAGNLTTFPTIPSLTNYVTLNTVQTITAAKTFSADVSLLDNTKLKIGTGSDLQIFHDTTTNFIDSYNQNLILRSLTADKDIVFQADDGSGGVATYFTVDGGAVENRFLKSTRHLDDVGAYFGDSADLQIYHDGSNSKITEIGTGDLFIGSSFVGIQDNSHSEYMAKFIADGAVELYHDNSKKFETTSTGVTITGGWVTDGVSVATANVEHTDNTKSLFGNGNDLELYSNGIDGYVVATVDDLVLQAADDVFIYAQGGEDAIIAKGQGAVELYYNNVKKLETTNTGVSVTGNVVPTGNVHIQDAGQLQLGTGINGKIYHDGNNFIANNLTGGLYIDQAAVTQSIIFRTSNANALDTTALTINREGDLITGADVTIAGDLTVNGTTTTINTQTLAVEDPLIELSKDNAANSVDIGFYGKYNDGTARYLGLFSDASDSNKFRLFKGTTVQPTTTVNIAGSGYVAADLQVAGLEATSFTNTGDLFVEDNIYLTDATTTRAKIQLNSSDRDNLDIKAVSLGSTMNFFTVDTLALSLDASQNATFEGDVAINGTTGITGLNGITFENGCILDDSIGAEYLKLKYNGAAAGGLQVFDNQNRVQGYLYASGGATSEFGLLNGAGQWGVRTTEGAGTALFYGASSEKLTTTSTGVSVTGNITIDNGTTSILTIEKNGTGNGKIQFNDAGSQQAYIALDASEDVTIYAAAGNEQIFYAGGALNETKSGGNSTFAGDITVSGGDITLGGTGRIQGVDTVSSNTDAANKVYVDNAIAGVPQVTIYTPDIWGIDSGNLYTSNAQVVQCNNTQIFTGTSNTGPNGALGGSLIINDVGMYEITYQAAAQVPNGVTTRQVPALYITESPPGGPEQNIPGSLMANYLRLPGSNQGGFTSFSNTCYFNVTQSQTTIALKIHWLDGTTRQVEIFDANSVQSTISIKRIN